MIGRGRQGVHRAELEVPCAGTEQNGDALRVGEHQVWNAVPIQIGHTDQMSASAGGCALNTGTDFGDGGKSPVGVAVVNVDAAVRAFDEQVGVRIAIHIAERDTPHSTGAGIGAGRRAAREARSVPLSCVSMSQEHLDAGSSRDHKIGRAITIEIGR